MDNAGHNEGGFAKLDSYEKEERPKGKEGGPLSNHVGNLEREK